MKGPLVALVLSCLAVGCDDAAESTEIETRDSSDLKVIEGEPSGRKIAPRAAVAIETAPAKLALIGGVVAIGTDTGVFATVLGANELTEIRVHPDQEGSSETGAVRTLSRRGSDGLLVVAEGGLFHAASGYLLSSPFEQSLDPSTITAIHARGLDAKEELWVVTKSGAYWVSGGKMTRFGLKGASAPITLAIGTEPGLCVVAAGSSAYLIDVPRSVGTLLAADLGTIEGGDAEEDGTVHLATSAGVLSRARSGEVTLRTLAPAGHSGQHVLSIASAFGSVFALTEKGVLAIEPSQAIVVGELPPKAGSLAIDASGDAWSVEDGKLYRYETSKPVSFAGDVAPFFAAHCDSCHLPGKSTAPDHEFSRYDTATEFADSIVRRLQATDATTMPPPNTEVLTASDYAIVLRWAKGGLLP